MTMTQLGLMLRARAGVVLATLLVTLLTAGVASLLLPRQYQATTRLVLNYKGVDPVTGAPLQARQMPGYMETQVDVIRSRRVALQVVDALRLAADPAMQAAHRQATAGRGDIRPWLAGQLLERLQVEPASSGSVLAITYTAPQPQQAAAVANAFADAYRRFSTQLKAAPLQQASGHFDRQVEELRANLERAQSRLTQHRQQYGMTSSDERLDVENTRLNELSQQLVAAEALAIEARSRAQGAAAAAANSPDVAANPLIQQLRMEAGRAESKLAELGQQLGSSHPQYEAAAAERDKLEGQLQAEIRRLSGSLDSAARIQQQREAALRMQMSAQKARVLELNRMRDQQAVLENDVVAAHKALESATQRLAESRIEARFDGGDIAVLSAAEAPGAPVSPKPALNLLLAALLGTLLGCALGLLAELRDRRVRSSRDVADLLGVPVVALRNRRPTVAGPALLDAAPPARYLT